MVEVEKRNLIGSFFGYRVNRIECEVVFVLVVELYLFELAVFFDAFDKLQRNGIFGERTELVFVGDNFFLLFKLIGIIVSLSAG